MVTKQINRRGFLKGAIAAGGALTAVSFLPEEWVDPVVKTGVLPVHAATSGGGTGTIMGTVYYWDDGLGSYVGDDGRTVILCNGAAEELEETTTSDGGYYSFSEVPAGSYLVFFGKGNYSPLIKLTGGETEIADFQPLAG